MKRAIACVLVVAGCGIPPQAPAVSSQASVSAFCPDCMTGECPSTSPCQCICMIFEGTCETLACCTGNPRAPLSNLRGRWQAGTGGNTFDCSADQKTLQSQFSSCLPKVGILAARASYTQQNGGTWGPGFYCEGNKLRQHIELNCQDTDLWAALPPDLMSYSGFGCGDSIAICHGGKMVKNVIVKDAGNSDVHMEVSPGVYRALGEKFSSALDYGLPKYNVHVYKAKDLSDCHVIGDVECTPACANGNPQCDPNSNDCAANRQACINGCCSDCPLPRRPEQTGAQSRARARARPSRQQSSHNHSYQQSTAQ